VKWIHILIKWLKLIDSVPCMRHVLKAKGFVVLQRLRYWNNLTCLIFTHEVLCWFSKLGNCRDVVTAAIDAVIRKALNDKIFCIKPQLTKWCIEILIIVPELFLVYLWLWWICISGCSQCNLWSTNILYVCVCERERSPSVTLLFLNSLQYYCYLQVTTPFFPTGNRNKNIMWEVSKL